MFNEDDLSGAAGTVSVKRPRTRRPTYEEMGKKTRARMRQELEDSGLVNISRMSASEIRELHQRTFSNATS